MKAVSANKEYTIDESQKKFYQDSGFDIRDEDGKVIAYGRGKTVPFGDYVTMEKAKKQLAEENEAMKGALEQLAAENEALKAASAQNDDPVVVEILTAYAEEHQVDIGRASTVSGIVKKIKEAKGGGGE